MRGLSMWSTTVPLLLATLGSPGDTASALDLLDANYVAAVYSKYDTSGMRVFGMAFAFDGNLYLGHAYSGEIWRVAPAGGATRLCARSIQKPQGLAAISSALYGDGLFVADVGEPRAIRILQPDGTSTAYAAPEGLPTPVGLAVDITGRYGGKLFFVSDGTDGVYSLDHAGKLERAEHHFAMENAGGPSSLAFDPTGRFGRRLYVTYVANPPRAGLYAVEPNGAAAAFAPNVRSSVSVAIDPRGHFGLDMFVCGPSPADSNYHLIRVVPSGGSVDFAAVRPEPGYESAMIQSVAFGPDGALYVAECYWTKGFRKVRVRVVRVVPRPRAKY